MSQMRPLMPNDKVIERLPPSKRKNVSRACKGCREQKVKCTGQLPCSKCVEMSRTCVYDSEDRRTHTSHKRKLEELERDKDLLDDLLDTIKHSKETEITQIVSLIRSNAPKEELKACIASQLLELRRLGREPSPELAQIRNDLLSTEQPVPPVSYNCHQRDVLQVGRLVGNPLVQVSAAFWTDVTADDELVGNLLSNWLRWDFVWYNWLDPELLLAGMKDTQQPSHFCSSFLVNSILAWACPYSDFREAQSQHGSTSTLMQKFVDEARAMLQREIALGPKLTTLQGMMFLFFSMSLMGQDRAGYDIMLLATQMAESLASTTFDSLELHPTGGSTPLREAVSHTCWGVFNLVSFSYLSFGRRQTMSAPTLIRPQVGKKSEITDKWTPYPKIDAPVQSFVSELFDVECNIALLVTAFTHAADQPGKQNSSRNQSEEDVSELEAQLTALLQGLPDHLRWSSASAAPLLMHHMWFRAVHLKMCLYQLTTTALAGLSEKDVNPVSDDLTKRCIKIAVDIAHLAQQYMENYGSKITCMATQPLSMALFLLLEHAPTESYHQEITDLYVLLRSLARRWPMSMAILRMVQHSAKQLGQQLPPSTDKLFEDFEIQDWKAEKIHNLESIYPDPESASYKKAEIQDMKKFLESMEALNMEKQS